MALSCNSRGRSGICSNDLTAGVAAKTFKFCKHESGTRLKVQDSRCTLQPTDAELRVRAVGLALHDLMAIRGLIPILRHLLWHLWLIPRHHFSAKNMSGWPGLHQGDARPAGLDCAGPGPKLMPFGAANPVLKRQCSFVSGLEVRFWQQAVLSRTFVTRLLKFTFASCRRDQRLAGCAEDAFGASPGCSKAYNTGPASLLMPKPQHWSFAQVSWYEACAGCRSLGACISCGFVLRHVASRLISLPLRKLSTMQICSVANMYLFTLLLVELASWPSSARSTLELRRFVRCTRLRTRLPVCCAQVAGLRGS